MTMKEQERKALEQIRKIVAGLGEGSYIGTAFEGCFEIAEENIENDFACSMKQRAEAAEKKVSDLEKENKGLRIAINREKDEHSQTVADLLEQIANLKKAIIEGDDLCDFGQMVDDQIFTENEKMKQAAGMIIELADCPKDIAFENAVRNHRNAKRAVEYWSAIKTRIIRAKDAYTAMNY